MVSILLSAGVALGVVLISVSMILGGRTPNVQAVVGYDKANLIDYSFQSTGRL